MEIKQPTMYVLATSSVPFQSGIDVPYHLFERQMYFEYTAYKFPTSSIWIKYRIHRLIKTISDVLSWPLMDLGISLETRKFLLLLVIYGVYLLSGAAIFQALETVNDIEHMTDIGKVREVFMLSHNLTNDEFDLMVHKLLEIVKRRCEHLNECGERWDYYSSVYFAVSVVTTIGYGHLSPETPGGKVFCMIFALFGIPLNIMILKLVGDRTVAGIQLALRSIEKRYFSKEVSKLRTKTVTILLCLMILMLVLGGILYNLTEPWTFLDGLYFCFVTFTTIGFGDLVPNEGKAPQGHYQAVIEVARAMVLVLGLSVIFAFVHLVLAFSEDIPEPEQEYICQEKHDAHKASLFPEESSKTLQTKHKSCNE